jgi:hypothetical protein
MKHVERIFVVPCLSLSQNIVHCEGRSRRSVVYISTEVMSLLILKVQRSVYRQV